MTIKETYITENVRVTIKETEADSMFKYLIQTEQRAFVGMYPWEVGPDGWRSCVSQAAQTLETATKLHEEQVASERRWH